MRKIGVSWKFAGIKVDAVINLIGISFIFQSVDKFELLRDKFGSLRDMFRND
jgi:hypothetical protein